MCNQYIPAKATQIARQFGITPPPGYRDEQIFPHSPHWFVRRDPQSAGYQRELVKGQWGLIPWFAKTPNLKYATNNARSEELTEKASYKQPWAKGQRCIIPVSVFWEPCWETGKNIWWSFKRADGDAFGLAGLWNTWTNKETGELFESYTMLTINADHHPLMKHMHKPVPTLPPDAQDKRMVIVLEPEAWDEWLEAPIEQVRKLMACAPAKIFAAQEDPSRSAR